MSHFFAIAIIPADCADPEAEIERILAPYSENLEAPEYEEECYCVNDERREQRNRMLEACHPSIELMREQHSALRTALNLKDNVWTDDNVKEDVELSESLWRARIDLRDRFEKAILARVGEDKQADPKCEECNGTGKRKSTYNPKSKWDWYSIGGRWNGCIRNAEESSEDGFNFGDQYRQLGPNVIPVADYCDLLESMDTRDSVRSFAVITPDGTWLQKGDMGWWGMVSNEQDAEDWTDCLIATFDKYRTGYVAVGLDLHI